MGPLMERQFLFILQNSSQIISQKIPTDAPASTQGPICMAIVCPFLTKTVGDTGRTAGCKCSWDQKTRFHCS